MPGILILIIEDEEAIAEMYATNFKQAGYDVEIATSGEEGFEKMVAKNPALVLMDIVMPGISGEETVEKAKHDPSTRNIPIIMLTNFSESIELKNAMRQGAADYIIKSEATPAQVVERSQKFIAAPATSKTGKHRYLSS